MAVTFDGGAKAPQDKGGPIVADRPLYLDASGNKIVGQGDEAAASLLAPQGHPISQADADRLGLVVADGKVAQDHAVTVPELRAKHDALVAEQAAFNAEVESYKAERAVKEIPNTVEAERVALAARVEASRLVLAQAIKTGAALAPEYGESQIAAAATPVVEGTTQPGSGE